VQLEANQVVAGKFRLNRMIGRGGMGSVWHATHIGLDTECAVKFIEGEFAALPEAHQRFEREAKAAAQLRSPHVVQIMDNGVWEGRPYIAMELLDGEDLRKRLATGKMAPTEVSSILTQVCRALAKAHALGIVHRDIKPDNIFLVRDDDREIAKVLDFGIAKRSDTLDGSNTRTGAMLGTPYYMSPEQAQGVKSVDHRSDLWSLAVIAYQAIVGQLPFQSEALGDLLVKIIVQPAPTPSMVAQVPPGFDAWWAKAIQRDPAQRFQSAKDFAESLTLAVGASQLTDVIDGRLLRSQIAAMTPGQTGSASAPQLPFGQTPQPNINPKLAQTPPSAMAHSVSADQQAFGVGASGPFQNSASSSSGGFQAGHGSTGAPFTTTATGATPIRTGPAVSVILGGIFAGILAAGFAVFAVLHFTSHSASSAATASATPSATQSVAAASASASSIPSTTTTAVASASVTTSASAAASSAPSAAVATQADHVATSATASSHGAHGSHAGTAASGGKAKSEDGMDKMGF